jgi:glycosyltransferase involved in cell wall biosynthesis/LmbE family N-acetylglucosaminyl deacetylase
VTVPTVAIIAPYFSPKVGGVESYAERLARAVQAAPDLDVLVVTTNAAGRRTVRDEVRGLPVVRLAPWLTLSNTPMSPLWPVQLRRLLDRHRVDLVSVHSPVPYLADVTVAVAGRRRPVVLTYHSGSLVKGRRGVDTLLRGYERYVLPRVFARADALVAVSDTSLAARVPGARMIPPGVDTDVFTPGAAPTAPPTVLYVGRIERSSAWKGIAVLLRAFAGIAQRLPSARLELAGGGDAVGGFRREAAELGIADRVRFLGVLSGSDLVDAYRRASVVALPSLTEAESFGMALVEAMSCGRPVVGSRVGGIPGVVTDGYDGLLVPPGDPVALSTACLTVLTDGDLAARLGRAGRRTAVSRFAWSRQLPAYLDLFRDLLDRGAEQSSPHRARSRARTVGDGLVAWTSRRWRRALVERASDGTALLRNRRTMVLSPHPDDETFGCGATIARARAGGDPVTVVVATDGRHSTSSRVIAPADLGDLRAAELRAACRTLGVPDGDLLRLGFEDGTLAAELPALTARLAEVLADRRPDLVLVPCAQDIHPDHRALHRALRTAVGTSPGPPTVLEYPVWTWMHAPWFLPAGVRGARPLLAWSLRQLRGGRWIRVDAGPYLAVKRAALDAYASQLTNLTGEPTWSFLSAEFRELFTQPTELFRASEPRARAT